MKYQAILGSKALPGVGQITVPFPIPDSKYDHIIGMLENMSIGSPTVQDCWVLELDSPYPILNRLVSQCVNVDELDYLARRLDSFSEGENIKFEAMASKLNLSSIRDFINLTFCCQRATVITDFSDLEQIGKAHALTINGGSMPSKDHEQVDDQAAALDLIQSGAGVVTPYGVVYGNGMKLEQIYDSSHLPAYYYKPCVAAVVLSLPGQGGQEMLYFPCAGSKIARAVQRLGVSSPTECEAILHDTNICDTVLGLFEDEFLLNEHLDTLNRLARCCQGFQGDDLEKFHTVFDYARPQTPEEAVYLAESLQEFIVINGISTAEEYGRNILDSLGIVPGPEWNVRSFGQCEVDDECGLFGNKGYVGYNGARQEVREILGRHIQPTQETQMGGLA